MIIKYFLFILRFDGKEEVLKAVFVFEIDSVFQTLEGFCHLTAKGHLIANLVLIEVNFK